MVWRHGRPGPLQCHRKKELSTGFPGFYPTGAGQWKIDL